MTKKSCSSIFEVTDPGPRKEHKRQILRSALECFTEYGIEATTVETIRVRADSSVGTIYHHFGNKEGLIAALFFAALDDQLALIQPRMKAASTPKEAIEQLIRSYLEWVARQPDMARFLMSARHQVATGPFGKDLAERNKIRYGGLQEWLAQGVKNGTILALPKEIYASLLIGPAESFCRAWLSGRVKGTPTDYAEIFSAAAWRAVGVSTAV